MWLRRLDGWLETASERLNPILVKETRQALKSKQFALWFLLLLAACWVITIGGIAWVGPGVRYAASGGVLFLAYYFVLCVALLVVAPFSAFRSLAAEQEDNTRDVLMVSALSPTQMINGKLGSAVLQMVVYLSALTPCLAFTYLLRGIDLLTIVFLPALAFVESIGLCLLGLLLASASRQRFAQVLTSVALVATLMLAVFLTYSAAMALLADGGAVYRDPVFWATTAFVLTFYLCAGLLMYHGAAALNSFASANRSTALRRVLLLTQACFIGWVAGIWFDTGAESEGLVPSFLVAMLYWAVAGAALTAEGPIRSERVRRTLPATGFGRTFATWFNPGPGTGYLFVVANTLALLVLVCIGLASCVVRSKPIDHQLITAAFAAAYVIGLLGIGRLLIDGLRRVAKLSLLGGFLVQFLLVLACTSLPELLRASITRYGRLTFTRYDLISPTRTLKLLIEDQIPAGELILALAIVVGGAFCVLLLNLTRAAAEVQITRAPLPRRVVEDEEQRNPTPMMVANPWGDVRAEE